MDDLAPIDGAGEMPIDGVEELPIDDVAPRREKAFDRSSDFEEDSC